MYGDTVESAFEPTVLGAVWRYRWLVVFVAIGFAGLGWLYGTGSERWTATATVTVHDPRASVLFEQGTGIAPDRFVADQVAILRSRAAAALAVERLLDEDPPIEVDVITVTEQLSVSSTDRSNVVDIEYTGDSPVEAIAVVNAVVEAYQTVRRQAVQATFADVLASLDESIAEIEAELAELQAGMVALREGDPRAVALRSELGAAVTDLLAFQFPDPATPAADLAVASARIGELRSRIDTLREALDETVSADEIAALVAQQDDARRRLGELKTRRLQLSVDAELTGSGIVFFDQATDATRSSVGLWLVLGGMGGALLGSGLAYLLAHRRRRFLERTEPAAVLGTRLIADVPNFREERLTTLLPVVEAPASAAAESFRFVAAAIAVQQVGRHRDRASPPRSAGADQLAAGHLFGTVAVASADVGDGKSVVAANTAIAAAREGSRVLAVDADFGSQAMTEILGAGHDARAGLTELARAPDTLDDIVVSLTFDHGGTVDLLSRGLGAVRPPDFFTSPEVANILTELGNRYDLVIVDTPPLLRVAYSTAILRRMDRVLVVVSHRSDVGSAQELRRQLDLIDTPLLGYVYNQAPLRPEMTLTLGSMADRLGVGRAGTGADASV
jgi:Mrp family chromosome partitioning ATPase